MAETMIAPARESVTPDVGGDAPGGGLAEMPANGATSRIPSDVGFVTTADGDIIGVILSGKAFEEYEEYLVDKGMAQAARESEGETGRPLSQFVDELRLAGEVDV